MGNKCSICHESMGFYTKNYTTKCNHQFHYKCARRWLYYGEKTTCPLCNQETHWMNPDIFLHFSGY